MILFQPPCFSDTAITWNGKVFGIWSLGSQSKAITSYNLGEEEKACSIVPFCRISYSLQDCLWCLLLPRGHWLKCLVVGRKTDAQYSAIWCAPPTQGVPFSKTGPVCTWQMFSGKKQSDFQHSSTIWGSGIKFMMFQRSKEVAQTKDWHLQHILQTAPFQVVFWEPLL